jgi:3-oxoacyl-[acyl-carrier protein] reductase
VRDLARIDVLVCSAGITGPNVPTWEYRSIAGVRSSTSTSMDSFHCNRAVVPIMLENDYGRIVNIASVAGKEGNPNASAYSASKAACDRPHEIAREGARGDARPRELRDAAAVRTAIFEQMTQQHIDFMLSKIPIGRFGAVEEVAALICWLASEECSVLDRRGVRHLRRTRDLLATRAWEQWAPRAKQVGMRPGESRKRPTTRAREFAKPMRRPSGRLRERLLSPALRA